MLTLDWIGNFGYSVLRLSTPLIFAGMAAVISKKAGMMNMALAGQIELVHRIHETEAKSCEGKRDRKVNDTSYPSHR